MCEVEESLRPTGWEETPEEQFAAYGEHEIHIATCPECKENEDEQLS